MSSKPVLNFESFVATLNSFGIFCTATILEPISIILEIIQRLIHVIYMYQML